MVSKLSTLNNNETDETSTKTDDNDNDTDKGETAMGDDTEPNERELILGVLSSDNLANEMSSIRVSPEVGVEIYLGTAIGVKMVVGVEGARYNISVITNDWIEREGALLGY